MAAVAITMAVIRVITKETIITPMVLTVMTIITTMTLTVVAIITVLTVMVVTVATTSPMVVTAMGIEAVTSMKAVINFISRQECFHPT